MIPNAIGDLCDDFKDCVLCEAFNSSKCTYPCFGVLTVKKVHISSSKGPETFCEFQDLDMCKVTFVVSFKIPLFPLVFVEKAKTCPEPERPRCIGEGTGLICSGHGRCVNGLCQCYFGYFGKFCEKCKYCDDYCNDLKYCVQCKVFSTGPLCSTNCFGCFQPRLTDYAKVLIPQAEQQCRFIDDNLCTVSFVYSNFGGSRRVFVDENKECVRKTTDNASGTGGSKCIGANGMYCSGHGMCIDEEKCHCRRGFYGKHCEKCQECEESCSDFIPCVLCRLARTGPLCGQDCSERCFTPILVDGIWSTNMSRLKKCRTADNNGCMINFAFKPGTKDVYVDKGMSCMDSFSYVRDSILYAGHILKDLQEKTSDMRGS